MRNQKQNCSFGINETAIVFSNHCDNNQIQLDKQQVHQIIAINCCLFSRSLDGAVNKNTLNESNNIAIQN